jgi:hypothetical protein
MRAAIDERVKRLAERLRPDGEIECMIVHEIVRAGVQMDVCHDQLIEDHIRVHEKTDSDWHADRTREANRLGARIAADPLQVAGQLEESLHGVNWLLYNWRSLLDEATENGGLDEPQRQLAFDLLGVPVTLRRGTSKVPAGQDAEGLKALCEREIRRLEARIVLELEGRDKRARAKDQLGLPVVANDTATRRARSNESRAYKRMVWAIDTFNRLRAGVSPALIIDPETGRPLRDEAVTGKPEPQRPRPQPEPASPPLSDPGPPPAPAAAPATIAAADDPIPLPENVSGEKKETIQVVGEMLRTLFRAGLLQPPAAPLPLGEGGRRPGEG